MSLIRPDRRRLVSGTERRAVRFFLWPLLTLVAVVGVAAGCDDGAIPIDDLPNQVATRDCEISVACHAAPDRATCESSFNVAGNGSIQTLVAAVKRGTVSYDADLAAACLAQDGGDCAFHLQQPESCRLTFRGKVAPGGVCVIGNECVDDGDCQLPAGCTAACCIGTCSVGHPRVALGGNCSNVPFDCVPGAFCNGVGICAALVAPGGVCASSSACQDPAICLLSSAGSGTCLVPPAEGQSCDPTQTLGAPCRRGDDYCDPVASRCVKRRPPGAACTDTGMGCVFYAPCKDGVCTATPTAGQACDAAAATAPCYGNLECTAGTCVLPADTAACVP
jgi:hypothetical protein